MATTTTAYCVKCKQKREMTGEKQIVMKNGRPATSGTCSVCGTKMFKIGGGGASAAGGGNANKAKPRKAVAKAKTKVKTKSKSKGRK